MRKLLLVLGIILILQTLPGCAHHMQLAKESCGKTNFIRQIQQAENVLPENCPVYDH